LDLATIVGFAGAMAMIAIAMVLAGGVGMFYNLPSLLIVVGGSIFVVLQKYTLPQYMGAAKVAGKAYSFKSTPPLALIEEIVELADLARKGGLLSLEGKEVSNDFLSMGIQLLVDGHDPEVVKNLLTKDMKMSLERHEMGAGIFDAFGDVAPAMGMVGTLVGLVGMLANMDDPKSIGPAMAVALLTTLYGSVLATVVALPVRDKLKLRAGEEDRLQRMIIDGLLAIQAGQNPRIIESLLKTYLASSDRGEESE